MGSELTPPRSEPPQTSGRATGPHHAGVGWLSLPAMRHPNAYVWLVFFSAMDIMLTWAILARGGSEVNPIADSVIMAWGLNGAITFKFSLMLLVIIVCEVVARSREKVARTLAWAAVIISATPVFYSLGLLLIHTLRQAP
jgi:hypothetical protein